MYVASLRGAGIDHPHQGVSDQILQRRLKGVIDALGQFAGEAAGMFAQIQRLKIACLQRRQIQDYSRPDPGEVAQAFLPLGRQFVPRAVGDALKTYEGRVDHLNRLADGVGSARLHGRDARRGFSPPAESFRQQRRVGAGLSRRAGQWLLAHPAPRPFRRDPLGSHGLRIERLLQVGGAIEASGGRAIVQRGLVRFQSPFRGLDHDGPCDDGHGLFDVLFRPSVELDLERLEVIGQAGRGGGAGQGERPDTQRAQRENLQRLHQGLAPGKQGVERATVAAPQQYQADHTDDDTASQADLGAPQLVAGVMYPGLYGDRATHGHGLVAEGLQLGEIAAEDDHAKGGQPHHGEGQGQLPEDVGAHCALAETAARVRTANEEAGRREAHSRHDRDETRARRSRAPWPHREQPAEQQSSHGQRRRQRRRQLRAWPVLFGPRVELVPAIGAPQAAVFGGGHEAHTQAGGTFDAQLQRQLGSARRA